MKINMYIVCKTIVCKIILLENFLKLLEKLLEKFM
jgi:hypothetical protein